MIPIPYLFLPNSVDREKLIRALYPLGITVDKRQNAEEGIARYVANFGGYPTIMLFNDDGSWTIDGGAPGWTANSRYTKVNSIKHFVEYTKRFLRIEEHTIAKNIDAEYESHIEDMLKHDMEREYNEYMMAKEWEEGYRNI